MKSCHECYREHKIGDNYNHDNPLIREIGNYNIQDLPLQIRCRLSKHFLSINIVSEHGQVSRIYNYT